VAGGAPPLIHGFARDGSRAGRRGDGRQQRDDSENSPMGHAAILHEFDYRNWCFLASRAPVENTSEIAMRAAVRRH